MARGDNITHLMSKSGLSKGDSLVQVVKAQKAKNAKLQAAIQQAQSEVKDHCREAAVHDVEIERLQKTRDTEGARL